jgi:hypothetical protein
MELYRKSDQYYIDEYDRTTIRKLKELEKDETIYLKGKYQHAEIIEPYNPLSKFYDKGVHRAKMREASIKESIETDENRDRLLMNNPISKLPKIECNKCSKTMEFYDHMFNNMEILFIFQCTEGHIPHKVVYPNGKEFLVPRLKCKNCNHAELISSTSRTNKILKCTNECKRCGKVDVIEFDLTTEKVEIINEADRKKYCIDFIGKRSFIEALKLFEPLMEIEALNKLKEEFELDKIERLTVQMLEKRLNEILKENGFTKFGLEKPEIKRNMIIPFYVQDAIDRKERDSVKILMKAIKSSLLHSNFRLMEADVSYRLGFIRGRLKAYESQEDLIIIAKEIFKKNKS